MRRAVNAILLLGLTIAAAAEPAGVNRDSEIIQDFNRRVADYVKLRKSVQSQTHRLKPTNSPEAIERYEHHLAHRIREARRGVGQGNIFTPEIAQELRRLIGTTMQGPDATKMRESLDHGAPVRLALRVDRTYPAGVPLETTPPSLLLNLPRLPSEVEYGVVGHDLVLRDIDANLIVDFMANAIP